MAEKSVELDSIELAAAIFGNCDQNVKLLENEFHVTAVCRGSLLKFTGELVTVKEAARIVYGDDTYASVRCITTLSGWITSGRGKRIPATVLARQIC